MIKNLESTYPKYDYKEEIHYIHVLGNGNSDDETQPLSSRLSNAGIKRVVEGVVIHKHSPNSVLIFTGYGKKNKLSNAQINANLAIALGVDENNIKVNPNCKDTYDEAKYLSSLIKDEKFVLVTSATHMPRAIKLFQSFNLSPLAAPTDFKREEFPSLFLKPGIVSLYDSQIALHEYLGKLANALKPSH